MTTSRKFVTSPGILVAKGKVLLVAISSPGKDARKGVNN